MWVFKILGDLFVGFAPWGFWECGLLVERGNVLVWFVLLSIFLRLCWNFVKDSGLVFSALWMCSFVGQSCHLLIPSYVMYLPFIGAKGSVCDEFIIFILIALLFCWYVVSPSYVNGVYYYITGIKIEALG